MLLEKASPASKASCNKLLVLRCQSWLWMRGPLHRHGARCSYKERPGILDVDNLDLNILASDLHSCRSSGSIDILICLIQVQHKSRTVLPSAYRKSRTLTVMRIQPPSPELESTSTIMLTGGLQLTRLYLMSMRPSAMGPSCIGT